MIDTVHVVQTPEGVELDLHVAGPVARALAWLVDSVLLGSLLLGLQLTLGYLGGFGNGVSLIASFGLWWFFPVGFEIWAAGQTPGKRMLGLRVVHEDGTPVGGAASVLRNFLRVVDFLPLLYAAGLLAMLVDTSFRRIGDLAAGTLVVYVERAPGPARAVPDVVPLAPPIPLSLEEQRAVVAFVERSAFLTKERAEELAAIPLPLLSDGEPRARLERIAAFLIGHRVSGAA